MSTLLDEIENYDACAAGELKKVDFQTDSEIQTLTLEDLHDLFPGLEKLKLRNTIFKIIHKLKEIDPFLEKLEDVSQGGSLRGDVIKECIDRIKDIKDQLDEKQTVLESHNEFPKDISKSLDSEKVCQPPAAPPPEPEELPHQEGDDQLSLQMEPGQLCGMEAEREAGAASVEKSTEVDFQTDSVVQILYKENLRQLFPGSEYLKLRRTIFQIIYNLTPAHLLLEELKGFTQQKSFYDAPVGRYLERIKNTKQQLDDMQIILEAHNNMQKDGSKSLDSGKDTNASMTASEMQKKKSISQEKVGGDSFLKGFFSSSSQKTQEKGDDFSFSKAFSSWFSGSSQKTQDSSSDTNAPLTTNKKKSDSNENKRVVRFKVEVSGKTFGADQQLLNEIKTPDLKWIEGEEHDITIVFCSVLSRVRADAEAAMRKVPGGDPVILVLMHYSQEPKHVSSSKVLSSYPNVLLEVNIFYHDRMKGLLKCRQNKNSVSELKEELQKYSRPQRSGSNHRNHSNIFLFS